MKHIKDLMIGFIIGGILFGIIGVSAAAKLEAIGVTYENEATSATNVEEALDELITKANEIQAGRSLIANTLTSEGVTTSGTDSWNTMATNINALATLKYNAGVSATKVGTATSSQVLTGYTFTNSSGVGLSGGMANRGALNWSPSKSTSYTVPAGYYSGGTISTSNAYTAGYNAGVSSSAVKTKTVTQYVSMSGGQTTTINTTLSGISKIIGFGAQSSTGATGTTGSDNPAIQIVSSSCTTTQLSVTYNHQKVQSSSTTYTWVIYYQ